MGLMRTYMPSGVQQYYVRYKLNTYRNKGVKYSEKKIRLNSDKRLSVISTKVLKC